MMLAAGHGGKRKYDPVRAAAIEALVQIEQGEQTDLAVQGALANKSFRPIDKRFFLQLVNGATKMRRRLDHEIKFYLARPSTQLPIKLSNILRMGFYQLHFTDRIPDAAAVSESVNLAHIMVSQSRARLVNAVLRAAIREPQKVRFASREEDPVKYLGDFYSYPDYFVEYCLREFGFDKTAALLEAHNRPPQVTYRVNYVRTKPDAVEYALKEAGVDFTPGKYLHEFFHINVGGLPLETELLKTGMVSVQDESAGMAVRLLNPRPNSSMVDLTAAPGGKATYAAVRMRNKGRVTAVDKSHARLKVLVDNARRQGIKIIAPVAGDMMDFSGGPFDRVLLDPPCSGWGTIGKNSDLRWAKTAEDTRNLVTIQSRMIEKAASLVKPGGILVYSTCTILRDENDQVIEEFLLRHRDFELESASEFFEDDVVSERGFVKTYPLIEGLDGAFAARLKRKAR